MEFALIILYLIFMLSILVVSIGIYVFQSLGYYTIAYRRGIHNPWLAWLPVGNLWILGSISDQYQYVVKGKIKNKRKTLLILDILAVIAVIAYVVIFVAGMVSRADTVLGGGVTTTDAKEIGLLLGALGSYFALLGIGIATMIIQYIALYDLYSSCDPKNDVLYLVLNIFVSITLPIFVFICRNKDLGMPPRKSEQAASMPPVQEPQAPWKPVDPTQKNWEYDPGALQQTDRPEPWENTPHAPEGNDRPEPWENNPEEE